jgi:phosphate transport system substrate-binding protein
MNGSRPARLLFLALLLLAACGEPVATPEPIYLRAAGSMDMAALLAELATNFGEQQPTISLEVTGLGTQYGLDALYAGDTDLAFASWLPPDLVASGQGLDAQYRATAIARDGIAIIVHPDNPLNGLGLLQLQDLFGGRVYDWQAVGALPALGQVQVVSREAGSGTRAAFETLVMDEQRVTPLAAIAPSPQAVADYVAGHPQAIGYASLDSVSPGVKALKIEGELPTPDSAGGGSYALTRELWLVTADPPPEGVQLFLDFVLSPAGQGIVEQHFGRIR